MSVIAQIEKENMRYDIPEFRPGDTVSVFIRIIEGTKERVQVSLSILSVSQNLLTFSVWSVDDLYES